MRKDEKLGIRFDGTGGYGRVYNNVTYDNLPQKEASGVWVVCFLIVLVAAIYALAPHIRITWVP